jgi:hypothetical protein
VVGGAAPRSAAQRRAPAPAGSLLTRRGAGPPADTDADLPAGERIGAAVVAVLEQVFATVRRIGPAAEAVLREVPGAAADLEPRVRELLTAPGQIAVGLGVIVAPRPADDFRLRLHWWQCDPQTDRLVALHPDLRPASLGFYDYTSADWFAVPRRTGRRHVMGPYVDVHGTGRYLLTLTEPVVAAGEFLGVVGADVPVSRFESHLLRELGSVAQPFLLLNDDDRVVLSSTPHRLVGDLVAAGDRPGDGSPLPGVPWRVLPAPTGRLLAG